MTTESGISYSHSFQKDSDDRPSYMIPAIYRESYLNVEWIYQCVFGGRCGSILTQLSIVTLPRV